MYPGTGRNFVTRPKKLATNFPFEIFEILLNFDLFRAICWAQVEIIWGLLFMMIILKKSLGLSDFMSFKKILV